jgi:hypothetical protein
MPLPGNRPWRSSPPPIHDGLDFAGGLGRLETAQQGPCSGGSELATEVVSHMKGLRRLIAIRAAKALIDGFQADRRSMNATKSEFLLLIRWLQERRW